MNPTTDPLEDLHGDSPVSESTECGYTRSLTPKAPQDSPATYDMRVNFDLCEDADPKGKAILTSHLQLEVFKKKVKILNIKCCPLIKRHVYMKISFPLCICPFVFIW